jgi:parallel beta-helix repeat protein
MGNDANIGTSSLFPWKELSRGRDVTFLPGDSILIKRGDTFEGAIADVFQGSPSQPIVIGTYETGNLPILYGDLRGRTWVADTRGGAGCYKAYLGGYGTINTLFWQWVSGAWKHSNGTTSYRSSNSATWGAFYDSLAKAEGNCGISAAHDTFFVHLYGNVSFPQTRDSIRVFRYGNDIQSGSHDVIIRDLDVRNYYIPIVVTGSVNVTTRKVLMRNGYSSCIRYITSQFGLIDSCVVDSSGDSGIYLVGSHRCVVRNNTVQNVLLRLDGGISAGIDLCGIGILDNYGWGRAQDTVGYNTVEYNKFDNIYNSFTDWYYCLGDTVRYNTGHNSCGSGSPFGGNLVMTQNTFTCKTSGGNGPNFALLGGNITYTYNTLDSIKDRGAWISANSGSGYVILNHNTFRMMTSARTFLDYKTTPNIVSTNNYFFGTGNYWIYNKINYTTLAGIQALGYEAGSTLNSIPGSPIGTLTATPDDIPINGGPVTLKWTSQNADSASISPNIGKVSLSGSKIVYVTSETEFILTLYNGTTTVQYPAVVENSPTSVKSESIIPMKTELNQNYPNPFNPSTTINYQLAVAGKVRLAVYDMIGREIAILADGMRRAGYYSERFDGSKLSSGTYFVRLEYNGNYMIKKIVLMK